MGDDEWKRSEVFREEARVELVERLMGGAEIGHSRWDVAPAEAAAIADCFLTLFDDSARFFSSGRVPNGSAQQLAPHARSDFMEYIFDGGCIGVDRSFAAIMWVLDND